MSDNLQKEFKLNKVSEILSKYANQDVEVKLIERFKKIRSEKIGKEEAKAIFKNMERVVLDENKLLFFLRVFVGLPKKECAITNVFKEEIKIYCKSIFEKNNIDDSYIASIGKEICTSYEPEKDVSKFVDIVQKHLKKPEYTKEDALAIAYIWLVMVCKEYRSYEYWKTIFIIERVFVLRFRTENEKDLKDCAFKSVPKAIANKTYEKQFLNISYLYTDYESKLQELSKKKIALEGTVKSLLSDNKNQCEKIAVLNEKISKLESALENSQSECDKIKDDLVLKDNMLKFEKNKFEQQFINKEKNLMVEVESVIGLEIEGIEGIANRLPEKEQERIMRYIRRIKERITELGG